MSSNSRLGTVKNYHNYICDDPVVQNIGLASYTRNSLEKFAVEKKNNVESINKDVDSYFPGGWNAAKPKFLGDSEVTLSILKYDVQTKRYILSTSDNNTNSDENLWWTPSGVFPGGLKSYQEKFDIWQKGFKVTDTEQAQLNYIWTSIYSSMSGCITFEVSHSALGCNRKSLVRLYFQAAGKANTDRGVAYRTDIVFAGTPHTAYQAPFSFANSQGTSLSPPNPGGNNNPQNTTAGQLRMIYDPTTGKWESGTQQILVVLLEDIDGVPSQDLPDDVDGVATEQLLAKFGTPNTGYGMPVGVHAGNPQLFGPYAYGCGPSPKHKIKVVNRTSRVFTKNETVICSLIGGEWIPVGLGVPKTVTKKFETEWSWIQKYIVDVKSFFRDSSDSKFVRPEDYVNSCRAKFYYNLGGFGGQNFTNPYNSNSTNAFYSYCGNDIQTLALLNLDPIEPGEEELVAGSGKIKLKSNISSVPNLPDNLSLSLSNTYVDVNDADVLSNKIGGSNTQSYIPYSNISRLLPDNEYGEVYAHRTINSWGMYFKEGYTAASVRKYKGYSGGYKSNNSYFYKDNTIDFAKAQSDLLHLDISDSFLYHMPAQIALNSSTNQTKILRSLWETEKYKFIPNYANMLITYTRSISSGVPFGDPKKYRATQEYIMKTSDSKDLFGLIPANSNSLQFTPLSLNLALCSTLIPDSAAQQSYETGGYKGLYQNLNNNYISVVDPTVLSRRNEILSPLFNRLQLNSAIITSTSFNGNILTKLPFTNFLFDSNFDIIVATERVVRSPDGGPSIFPIIQGSNGKERSNVVGVITAKGVVNLTQGGQLELRTTNNIGIQAGGQTTLSNTEIVTLPPGYTNPIQTDNSGRNFDISFVQWGSTGDEKDMTSFGTTALHCKVYDHCENTIYDGRYFAPLHFNPDTSDMDFKIPNPEIFPLNTKISQNSPATIEFVSCPIRRNMLLSGGGFYYIKNFIGADSDCVKIMNDGGEDYATEDIITFSGLSDAKFKVTEVDSKGAIKKIELVSRGEFTVNPFKVKPYYLEATSILNKNGEATGSLNPEKQAKIILDQLKVMQKVMKDEEPTMYHSGLLTPYDNGGKGDGRGIIQSARSTTVSLPQNDSGQYDIFVFFVNDIMNYFENGYGGKTGWIPDPPPSQYVNLEISAN